MNTRTRCKECGVSGMISVLPKNDGKEFLVKDSIRHIPTCSLYSPNRSIRKEVRRQERLGAKLIEGRVTIASGAVGHDADARSSVFRLEAKRTTRAQYFLSFPTWNTLVQGALSAGELPVLFIEFKRKEQCFVVREEDFTWVGPVLPRTQTIYPNQFGYIPAMRAFIISSGQFEQFKGAILQCLNKT